jgi:hypothetical protein
MHARPIGDLGCRSRDQFKPDGFALDCKAVGVRSDPLRRVDFHNGERSPLADGLSQGAAAARHGRARLHRAHSLILCFFHRILAETTICGRYAHDGMSAPLMFALHSRPVGQPRAPRRAIGESSDFGLDRHAGHGFAGMCLARRSARDRMLLHQETAACGSNALAHADPSLMAPVIDSDPSALVSRSCAATSSRIESTSDSKAGTFSV